MLSKVAELHNNPFAYLHLTVQRAKWKPEKMYIGLCHCLSSRQRRCDWICWLLQLELNYDRFQAIANFPTIQSASLNLASLEAFSSGKPF